MCHSSYIAFILFSILYIFSLAPVFSTGDAGGLIVSSYTLGVAHPPGYPFFSVLGKIFSFLPLGNIGIKVALMPCVFSILTLLMVYLIIHRFTKSAVYSLLGVITLGVSYSFFFQTSMIKFYPANSFLVLLLLFLGIKITEGFDRRLIFASAFIIGLMTGLHHTGLFMIIPLFVIGLLYRKEFFKNLPLSAVFFLAGFLVNLHLYIRSIEEAFTAAHRADTLSGFFNMLLRRFYGESSSIDTVGGAFHSFDGYLNAMRNLYYLIDANFGIFTLVFVLMGLLFLYKKRAIFLLFIVSFFLYSIALAKMTFSGSVRDISTMYVVGNQYFIPFLSLYAILFALGVYFFANLISKFDFKIVPKVLPISLILMSLIFLPIRFSQTVQFNNWVPYYHGKDALSILPVSSVISTYGDNHTFEIWYMKIVGRFRDDLCHITSHYYNLTEWRLEGCKPTDFYKPLLSDFFSGNFNETMLKKRFYSTVALSKEHPFYEFVDVKPYAFIFAYIPKNKVTEDDEKFFKELSLKSEKFLTPKVCLNHTTDDPFTFEMCNFFSISYLVLASSIKPAKPMETLTVDASIAYGRFLAPLKLDIQIGKENARYIELYKSLRAYNDYRRCYLLE